MGHDSRRILINSDEATTMLKNDPIPTLTQDLILDRFDDYPEEVLECEWNPALEQLLQLRRRGYQTIEPQRLYAYPPELLTPTD
jgi:hypothetical protein